MFDILISAHRRYDLLYDFIKSIRRYHDNRIIVAEDSHSYSKQQINQLSVDFISMPFDCGIGAKRNKLVEKTTAPFFLMCDEDHLLLKNLNPLLEILKQESATIVSGGILGTCNNWVGFYSSIDENELCLNFLERKNKLVEAKFIPNFYMCKTDHFKSYNILWDAELHLCDHIDFFMRFPDNLKILHYDEIFIKETQEKNNDDIYKKNRFDRIAKYFDKFKKKYRLKKDPVKLFNVKKPDFFPSINKILARSHILF